MQVILGGAEFTEKSKIYLKRKKVGQDVVERKRLLASARPEEVIRLVASAFDVAEDSILNRDELFI